MSLIEKRAWLTLWTMCPGYLVYFAIQLGWPQLAPTVLSKFGLLAAVAGLHAIGYIAGELAFRYRNREEGLQKDERDDGIDRGIAGDDHADRLQPLRLDALHRRHQHAQLLTFADAAVAAAIEHANDAESQIAHRFRLFVYFRSSDTASTRNFDMGEIRRIAGPPFRFGNMQG